MKMKSLSTIPFLLVAAALAFPPATRGQTNPPAEAVEADLAGVIAYKVVPQDNLTITVYNEKELTGDYLVSNDGKINFPLLDTVSVSGLRPDEIAVKLKKLLEADYLVHAYVHVDMKTFRSRVVTLLGEVLKPGAVEFSGVKPMGLLEALARSGGLTPKAEPTDILITRGGKNIHFNYKQFKKNPEKNPPPSLEDGDIITVRESVF